jgi:hypothetical protein
MRRQPKEGAVKTGKELADFAFDLMMTELIVALHAKGLLSGWEIAQAIVRSEVTAETSDAVSGAERQMIGAAMAVLSDRLERRLALRPELYAVRERRRAWISRREGPDPAEPEPPQEPPRNGRRKAS